MFVIDQKDCEEFIAGDGSILRELLHPDKAELAIRFSLARARVKPGQTTLRHRLKTAEVYYIVEGGGTISIDGESRNVREGQAIYIPPLSWQSIHNPGPKDLIFLCMVDPAWRREDEETA